LRRPQRRPRQWALLPALLILALGAAGVAVWAASRPPPVAHDVFENDGFSLGGAPVAVGAVFEAGVDTMLSYRYIGAKLDGISLRGGIPRGARLVGEALIWQMGGFSLGFGRIPGSLGVSIGGKLGGSSNTHIRPPPRVQLGRARTAQLDGQGRLHLRARKRLDAGPDRVRRAAGRR